MFIRATLINKQISNVSRSKNWDPTKKSHANPSITECSLDPISEIRLWLLGNQEHDGEIPTSQLQIFLLHHVQDKLFKAQKIRNRWSWAVSSPFTRCVGSGLGRSRESPTQRCWQATPQRNQSGFRLGQAMYTPKGALSFHHLYKGRAFRSVPLRVGIALATDRL